MKFKVYKNCHIGIVINRIDKSIHLHDAEYEYEEETYVENKAMQRMKEFQAKLNSERARKTNEVKIDTAKRILGGDEFSYQHYDASTKEGLDTIPEGEEY